MHVSALNEGCNRLQEGARRDSTLRSILSVVLAALLTACDVSSPNLDHEVTLAAAVDEDHRPIDIRNRFSLADELIHIYIAIPPETAGAVRRDFHFEIFDGESRIISARGGEVAREREDWLVASVYRINPEIDAPGLWSVDVYVDGRHIERLRFPVTEAPSDSAPDALIAVALPGDCCQAPGPMTQQVFLSTGVDEETLLLRGRRESFRLSDERVYVYLRLNNVSLGEHEIRYDYYNGAGELLGHYDHAFKVENRSWIAWSWWDFRPDQDAPDVWTIDIRFDGNLIGSVEVLVEA